jgi:predicted ATPase/class 3 adenylate cyclase
MSLDPSTRPHRDATNAVVSMLFTDIEGATLLLHRLGSAFPEVLERHHDLLRASLNGNGGQEVDAHADSFFAVFDTARGAVAAAVSAQLALEKEPWPARAQVRVRMGVHLGTARLFEGKYVGLDVHRAARICAAGHGGQVLLSKAAWLEVGESGLPPGIEVRDLGSHRLKGLRYPESIFELRIPGLPERFAPVQSLDNHPNNLPATEATPIVGREDQINDLCGLLTGERVRLVTLTGCGGTGKTRLSVEVAMRLAYAFPDGVFQVLLAPVQDPALVATHIAQSLGMRELPGLSAIESLVQSLGTGKVLLLLDNFEQVVDSADQVAALISACPRLTILITSREPLNLGMEREYAILPLETPPQQPSLEALKKCDSVRLLVEKVRTFQSDFGVTADNASALAEICRRLDGLPLAIELAASHLRVLKPQALLDRLSRRLDLLKGGTRDMAARQRTLRDTIAWSYNLLNREEQKLFTCACVFSGGFDVSALEAICPLTDDLLGRLSSLNTKSLVTRTVLNGEPRLNMLETIREYGLERLGADASDLRHRHSVYFAELADRLAPDLLSRGQRRSVVRLLDEGDNIRTALAWALQQPDAKITSKLVNALLWLWIGQGHFIEGKYWVDQALQQVDKLGGTREKAIVLDVAGWLSLFSGDYASAFPYCDESGRIYQGLQFPVDVARTKMTAGLTGTITEKCLDGPQRIIEALEEYRSRGDRYGTAMALIALGAISVSDPVSGEKCFREALVIMEELGNVYWPSVLRHNLALHFRMREGNWKQAAELLNSTVEPAQEYNYPVILNLYLAAMGGIAIIRDRPADAARLYGATSRFLKELGATFEPPDQSVFEENRAAAVRAMGESAFIVAFEEGARWSKAQAIAAARALCSD